MAKNVSLVVALLLAAIPAYGWGSKGHEISARAAVNALPKEFPAFFLAARERLVYLCPEPDRWKGGREAPALAALNAPDHYFDLEAWGAEKIPNTRYELILNGVKRGVIGVNAADNKPVSGIGTAPVAIAEMSDKLANGFKLWREAREDTANEKSVKHQIEDNIVYLAGVLAHFVTDLANPMHCTVHHNGWAESYPNPQGYPLVRDARGMHSRFESQYVDSSIDEKDIPALIPPGHRAGAWVPEMETFIRRNNGMVDQIYQMDRKNAFGSGGETAEERAFVLQRLADGAGMLRDVWSTAWIISHDQWINESVTVYGRGGKTVLELLRERNHVETKKGAPGETVTTIGTRASGMEGRDWACYVNGQRGAEPAGKYVPRDNERVEWRFEEGGRGKR